MEQRLQRAPVPDPRILILGYGNPGRRDDGLGPAAAEAIEAFSLCGVRTSANYQLMIEDACDAAESDVVIFIDAAKSGPEPYSVSPVQPAMNVSAFASHVVAPELVLGLSGRVYGHLPRALLVGIRGYAFEFEEGLSARAQANLARALVHIRNVLIGRRAVMEISKGGALR
jgi:hydrogenase maturation protease